MITKSSLQMREEKTIDSLLFIYEIAKKIKSLSNVQHLVVRKHSPGLIFFELDLERKKNNKLDMLVALQTKRQDKTRQSFRHS